MQDFKIKGFVKDITHQDDIYSKRSNTVFRKTEITISYPAKKRTIRGLDAVIEKDAILVHFMSKFQSDHDSLEEDLLDIGREFMNYEFYEVEAQFFIDSKISVNGYSNTNLVLNSIKRTTLHFFN